MLHKQPRNIFVQANTVVKGTLESRIVYVKGLYSDVIDGETYKQSCNIFVQDLFLVLI